MSLIHPTRTTGWSHSLFGWTARTRHCVSLSITPSNCAMKALLLAETVTLCLCSQQMKELTLLSKHWLATLQALWLLLQKLIMDCTRDMLHSGLMGMKASMLPFGAGTLVSRYTDCRYCTGHVLEGCKDLQRWMGRQNNLNHRPSDVLVTQHSS